MPGQINLQSEHVSSSRQSSRRRRKSRCCSRVLKKRKLKCWLVQRRCDDDLVRQPGPCPGPALHTRPSGYQYLSEEILETNKERITKLLYRHEHHIASGRQLRRQPVQIPTVSVCFVKQFFTMRVYINRKHYANVQ
jgi:hypothetical protein